MARQITGAPEHHRPWQRGIGHPAPELTVDEIAHTPGRQTGRHARRDKVHHLQPGPLAAAGVPDHGYEHAEHAAVKAHATGPDIEHLQRMAEVIQRLVEQAIAQASADDNAHDTQEQDVFDVARLPGSGLPDGNKGFVLQSGTRQQQKQPEGHKVGDAVPVDGQRANLQGNGIDLGMGQHGLRLCTQAMPMPGQSRRDRSRTAPLSADMASLA